MLHPKLISFFPLVLLGTIVMLGAQDEKPATAPTLPEVKREFRDSMREAMATSAQPYIAELQKLEKKLASAGDFEGAIDARDERLALEKFLGNSLLADTGDSDEVEAETPVSELGNIELKDTAADVSDGGQFNEQGLDLSEAGATASWTLGEIEPGGYEIFIQYSLSAETEVQMKENFFRISSEIPATDGEPSNRALGTLKITDVTDTLSLVHIGERTDLIIHSVQLRSAKE